MIVWSVIALKIALIISTVWFFYLAWNRWLKNFLKNFLDEQINQSIELNKALSSSQKKVSSQQTLLQNQIKQAENLEQKIKNWTDALEQERRQSVEFFANNTENIEINMQKRERIQEKELADLKLWNLVCQSAKTKLLKAWEDGTKTNSNQIENAGQSFEKDESLNVTKDQSKLNSICKIIANFWLKSDNTQSQIEEAKELLEFFYRHPEIIVQLQTMRETNFSKTWEKISQVISSDLNKIIEIILEKNRGHELKSILQKAIKISNAEKSNIKAITVITSLEMSEEQKKSILTNILKKYGHNSTVTFICRPGIGGGFIIQGNGLWLDNSEWSKLMQTQMSFSYFKGFLPDTNH